MKPTIIVTKLYGRCLMIQVGKHPPIEVKVMGDRTDATQARDLLIAALAAVGLTVNEPVAPATQRIADALAAKKAAAAKCSDSPACAATGCADCERSYGPRRTKVKA